MTRRRPGPNLRGPARLAAWAAVIVAYWPVVLMIVLNDRAARRGVLARLRGELARFADWHRRPATGG
ncbi:MAG: hypothetical protein JWO38_6112 [Gemmataceae bacterium]|nr:hypothetical protein [Gemmataceae bacterium]